MISLKHIKNGCLVLRKQSNSNFHLKICPVSLTSAPAALEKNRNYSVILAGHNMLEVRLKQKHQHNRKHVPE